MEHWNHSEAPGMRFEKNKARAGEFLKPSSARLMEAARGGHVDQARAAMMMGEDPRHAGDNLLTPLGVAVRLDDAKTLEAMLDFLKQNKALKNRDELRSTHDVGLMQEAARSGSAEAWRALARAGFDSSAKDGTGWTAERWAKERGNWQILSEIEKSAKKGKKRPEPEPQPEPKGGAEPAAAAPSRAVALAPGSARERQELLWPRRAGFFERLRDFFFGAPPPAERAAPAAPLAAPAAEASEWGIDFSKALRGLRECGLGEEGERLAERAVELAQELSPRGRMPAAGLDALELKRVWEVNIPLLAEAIVAVPSEYRGERGAGARSSPLESANSALRGAIERMEQMRSESLGRAQARIDAEVAVIEQNSARWGQPRGSGQEAGAQESSAPGSAPRGPRP